MSYVIRCQSKIIFMEIHKNKERGKFVSFDRQAENPGRRECELRERVGEKKRIIKNSRVSSKTISSWMLVGAVGANPVRRNDNLHLMGGEGAPLCDIKKKKLSYKRAEKRAATNEHVRNNKSVS
jgi:hypothetical protein